MARERRLRDDTVKRRCDDGERGSEARKDIDMEARRRRRLRVSGVDTGARYYTLRYARRDVICYITPLLRCCATRDMPEARSARGYEAARSAGAQREMSALMIWHMLSGAARRQSASSSGARCAARVQRCEAAEEASRYAHRCLCCAIRDIAKMHAMPLLRRRRATRRRYGYALLRQRCLPLPLPPPCLFSPAIIATLLPYATMLRHVDMICERRATR